MRVVDRAANPASDSSLRFDVDNAREHVTLHVTGGRVTLSAAALERLAQQLGELRASMKPDVGVNPPQGSCPAVDRPIFAAQMTPDHSRIALGVRTPAFGWIAMMLDRVQVEGLAKYFHESAPTMTPRVN